MSEEETRIRIERDADKCGADFVVLPASLLRDLFAALAAAGLSASVASVLARDRTIAEASYSLADALMSERARRRGEGK